MKRYIYLLLASCVSAFTLQSCFQDMDHPGFDYPESSDEKVYSPLKMILPFEDDIRDKGNYGFLVTDNGNVKFAAEGINGMAYQGKTDAYALAKIPSYLADSIPNLKNCTVAFWMKSEKNTTATGLFSIPNTKTFWGNFDIFLENNSSSTQAFFKMHILNQTSKENDERWVEAKIDNIFGAGWVHMAFVYDGKQSMVTIYRNGESVLTKELAGCGELKFKNLSTTFAIGAFQFSTKPSLTEGSKGEAWAFNFPGQLDQFRFYDRAISASDIQKLYSGKE